jgi:transcriptional regulator with XRE-family HTH domain
MLRENMGINQNELADKLCLSRSSVSAWEKGLNIPSAKILPELSKIFGVSVDVILCIDSNDATMCVEGLDNKEIDILISAANKFRANKDRQL